MYVLKTHHFFFHVFISDPWHFISERSSCALPWGQSSAAGEQAGGAPSFLSPLLPCCSNNTINIICTQHLTYQIFIPYYCTRSCLKATGLYIFTGNIYLFVIFTVRYTNRRIRRHCPYYPAVVWRAVNLSRGVCKYACYGDIKAERIKQGGNTQRVEGRRRKDSQFMNPALMEAHYSEFLQAKSSCSILAPCLHSLLFSLFPLLSFSFSIALPHILVLTLYFYKLR